jgi:acetolactate synthase-1/2/3 large subunit
MIDIDVQKHDLGFWHFPTSKSWQADTLLCLNSMNQQLENHSIDTSLFASRTAWIEQAKKSLKLPDMPPLPDDRIHLQHLCQAVKDLVNEKTILLFESPTATERLLSTLEMNQPGSYFANGGSGLGWGINAAIGAKLAKPHSEVISFVGDGSFIFGVPSSAYWVGKTYGTPQLTIVSTTKVGTRPRHQPFWSTPKGRHKPTTPIGSPWAMRVALLTSHKRPVEQRLTESPDCLSLDQACKRPWHRSGWGKVRSSTCSFQPFLNKPLGSAPPI